jgi:serine/threonine-protein kinase
VLYEMLVGEPPFTGSTPQAVLGKIITGEVPSAKAERASVPPNVDAVIAKALEKVPADRFDTAGSLAAALGDASFRANGRSSPSSRAGPSRLAAAMLIAAGIAIGLLLRGLYGPSPSPQEVLTFRIPGGFHREMGVGLDFEVGPAGTGVVFTGPETRWYRPWGGLAGAPIRGSSLGGGFSVTPDGRSLLQSSGGVVRLLGLEDGSKW